MAAVRLGQQPVIAAGLLFIPPVPSPIRSPQLSSWESLSLWRWIWTLTDYWLVPSPKKISWLSQSSRDFSLFSWSADGKRGEFLILIDLFGRLKTLAWSFQRGFALCVFPAIMRTRRGDRRAVLHSRLLIHVQVYLCVSDSACGLFSFRCGIWLWLSRPPRASASGRPWWVNLPENAVPRNLKADVLLEYLSIGRKPHEGAETDWNRRSPLSGGEGARDGQLARFCTAVIVDRNNSKTLGHIRLFRGLSQKAEWEKWQWPRWTWHYLFIYLFIWINELFFIIKREKHSWVGSLVSICPSAWQLLHFMILCLL